MTVIVPSPRDSHSHLVRARLRRTPPDVGAAIVPSFQRRQPTLAMLVLLALPGLFSCDRTAVVHGPGAGGAAGAVAPGSSGGAGSPGAGRGGDGGGPGGGGDIGGG